MRRPPPLPEPLSHGAFGFQEAVRQGLPRSRLRAPDVRHPHRDVYVSGEGPSDLVDRCNSLRPWLGSHLWFSHLTAARLWGMPLPFPPSPGEPLHTIALAGTAPVRRPDVVGWETFARDLDRMLLGMLPIVGPADVWCQLAVPGATGMDPDTGRGRCLSIGHLVQAGDYVLTGPRHHGRRHPLCTLEELEQALHRRRGKRGAKTLAVAIDQVRFPVDSPKETQLRLALIAHGLPEPAVQVPVRTSAGWRHADLGYPAARLLLEYQGDEHRTDRARWLADLTRVQLFEDAGWRVVLVGADDLAAAGFPLAARIRRALAARHFDP